VLERIQDVILAVCFFKQAYNACKAYMPPQNQRTKLLVFPKQPNMSTIFDPSEMSSIRPWKR